MSRRLRARGFTLVELIMVITVTAVISVTVAVVVKPTVQAYGGVKARAELIDLADSAMRRIVRDVRTGVPNSIRTVNTSCFEVIPTKGGGRYRRFADEPNDQAQGCTGTASNCSAPLEPSLPVTTFDVLSVLSPVPVVGDFVIINNQNGNDVYEGGTRSDITALSTPSSSLGPHRITVTSHQFPQGYDGGRFQLVSKDQKAVFYVCSGADGTLDANGDGKGRIYRLKNYGFNSAYPSSCPSVVGADLLATKVQSCTFTYDPNKGATQQSGFLAIDLTITRNNESVHLGGGAHISNVP